MDHLKKVTEELGKRIEVLAGAIYNHKNDTHDDLNKRMSEFRSDINFTMSYVNNKIKELEDQVQKRPGTKPLNIHIVPICAGFVHSHWSVRTEIVLECPHHIQNEEEAKAFAENFYKTAMERAGE